MAVDVRPKVEHRPELSRYELVEDDGAVIGVCDYRDLGDGRVLFPHTEIAPARRGQGLGELLVAAAIDDVRGRFGEGVEIVPSCWFVAEFLGRTR